MVRDELQSASEKLAEASAAADGEVAETLDDQSEQLERLATRDRGPDHGRLARHENVLGEIAETNASEVADLVEAALADMRSYREGVEGV